MIARIESRRIAAASQAFVVALLVASPLPRQVGAADEPVYPDKSWKLAKPEDVGLDAKLLAEARDYALTGGGSGMITRHGRVVLTWGDLHQRYDLKSTTKSIGVTALGLAIMDGKTKLSDRAIDHHPEIGNRPRENPKTWREKITIAHLATQTAGFEKRGGYSRMLFEPGTHWDYSDSGPNWLAECITLDYERDLRDLLFERVFTPIGITKDDLTWRYNAYREPKIRGVVRREFGSGISADVDAMARIGYLYLRRGKWHDKQLIPAEFVDQCGTTVPAVVDLPEYNQEYDDASRHYGLLWWNNADGSLEDVPRDAYWSWGLYDSLIVVIPSLDIVAARAGKSWKRTSRVAHYAVLQPFLGPIARSAAAGARQESKQPQQSSRARSKEARRISGIDWAPPETVVHLARGSDNWPLTWGDDDRLYTAYGDGRGFEPFVEKKLSLGLARVAGPPLSPRGENLRSPTAEQLGDGAKGKKASGMLMAGGVLYMLVRNADNAQLAWSRDHGKTWTWADWKFSTSFGCPTLLNFGRDYAGARDEYVYVFSPDADSAYQAADRAVLARAPLARMTEQDAWQYFQRLDGQGRPVWTGDVAQRGGVLERAGHCYRGGVSYNAPLATYLWAMLPGGDTRHRGGLAVFAASEPWGPWREVYSTDEWDTGPGESASFPTRWISDDGLTVHLVFSGDDSFSVRRATLRVSP